VQKVNEAGSPNVSEIELSGILVADWGIVLNWLRTMDSLAFRAPCG